MTQIIAPFIGWMKRGNGPWQPVCGGKTAEEARTAVLGIETRERFVDKLVLRVGEQPVGKKKPQG
jgi:hypothetical protein